MRSKDPVRQWNGNVGKALFGSVISVAMWVAAIWFGFGLITSTLVAIAVTVVLLFRSSQPTREVILWLWIGAEITASVICIFFWFRHDWERTSSWALVIALAFAAIAASSMSLDPS